MDKPLKSPCVRNCCLDGKDMCLGCFRHLDEITGWAQLSETKKKNVLSLAEERKNGYKNLMKFL
ncbi:MAG: putative Fe-S protein YdhL (DUF1289 family) [Alteromonadaceae bacterium]|jgi:predicted Fe-S protein YdhL (DUF1289 family)